MTIKILPCYISDQLRNKFKLVKSGMSPRVDLTPFDAAHDGDELRVTIYSGDVSSRVRVNVHRTNNMLSIQVIEKNCRFIKEAKQFLTDELNKKVEADRSRRR